MCSLDQKVKNYKRAVVQSYRPFVEKGMLTAHEVEFIANGAIVKSLADPRTNKVFRGDR